MEETICGKSTKEIREAFFKRKLDALLDSIQASGNTNELDKLEAFLQMLQVEDQENKKKFKKFGDNEIKPPSVEELEIKVSEEKQKLIDAWLSQMETNTKQARNIMKALKERTKKGEKIKQEEWLDASLEIACLLPDLDHERVYRDQLYRKRLTNIIDTYGLSRAEAEERAKLTQEYRDYKICVLLRENLEEFIMLCKKYYSNQL